MVKYEFKLYEGNQIMVDKNVSKLQDEGWELAGEVTTKYSKNGLDRMLIPMKRKL